MNLYQKIRGLEDFLGKGNMLPLTQLGGQNRIVTDIKNGKIVYTHGIGATSDSFDIDLLYKSYFALLAKGAMSVKDLEKIDKNYTQNGTPCNAVTFMLLMNHFFDCKIVVQAAKGAPYVVIW